MVVQADNIPANTTIASVTSSTAIVLSAPSSTTATAQPFTVNGLVSFQWRSGTVSNPNWTAFITDQYELVNKGRASIIRVYGTLPRLLDNMMRVTYWAGWVIDWPNAGNNTTHQLPTQISDCVENLVVRRFKRRQFAGKTSEALDGATTAWNKDIDADDQDVIEQFRRMPTIY